MTVIFAVSAVHYLFSIPLTLVCIFLILLILVQRGRGGGLTGALGGMGGQSAFGTKAGDVFTRITIIVAAVWILLSMGAVKVLTQQAVTGGFNPAERAAPVVPGEKGDPTPDDTPPPFPTPSPTLPPAPEKADDLMD